MAKRKETQQKTDTKKPKQIAKNKPAPKTQKNKGIWDCIEIYLRSIIMYFVSKLFAEELKGSIAVAQLNEWTVIVEFSSRLMQTAAVCRCTDTLARVLLRCLFLTDAFQIKPFFLSFDLMCHQYMIVGVSSIHIWDYVFVLSAFWSVLILKISVQYLESSKNVQFLFKKTNKQHFRLC